MLPSSQVWNVKIENMAKNNVMRCACFSQKCPSTLRKSQNSGISAKMHHLNYRREPGVIFNFSHHSYYYSFKEKKYKAFVLKLESSISLSVSN